MNETAKRKVFDYDWLFSSMWKAAFVTGLATAVAATFLPSKATWIIGIPAFCGLLFGIVIELRCVHATEFEYDSTTGFSDPVRAPSPIAFFSNFWLALKRERKATLDQLDFFEQLIEDPADRRKVHVIATDQGDVFVLHCGRLQDLLVSRITEDLDKATEHALALALKKFAQHIDPQTEPLFRKTFREIIKADFRGNVAQLLQNVGDSLIRELVQTAERTEQETRFKLEAIEPKPSSRRRVA